MMNTEKISSENVGLFAMITHNFIDDSKNMSLHTRWLYVALVYYRNTKSGLSYPSYDTIRKLTGLRREMISRGLTELEEAGWIEPRIRRFGDSSFYKVIFNKKNE